MPVPQSKKLLLNHVYRRIESAERLKERVSVLPSLEIIGTTSINVYASNRPRQEGDNTYQSPIDDSEILNKMTFTDEELEPGFHELCLLSKWIAFVPVDEENPPELYDCGIIDWEFEFRSNPEYKNY